MTFRALPTTPGVPPADAPLEPVRFLAGGGSELERRLLHSARLDRVPAAAAARVASGLGVDLGATRSPSTAPGANPVSRPSGPLARFARLGALGGGGFAIVAALGWMGGRLLGPGTNSSPEAAVVSPSAVSGAEAMLTVTRPLAVASTASEAPPSVAGETSRSSPATIAAASRAPEASLGHNPGAARAMTGSGATRSPARPALARAERTPAGGLMAELRALETVQAALQRGRAAEAEISLAAYTSAFPNGELAPEAEMLRIDVALARGKHDRALALARAFVRRPEAARYRERLGALLGGRNSLAVEGREQP